MDVDKETDPPSRMGLRGRLHREGPRPQVPLQHLGSGAAPIVHTHHRTVRAPETSGAPPHHTRGAPGAPSTVSAPDEAGDGSPGGSRPCTAGPAGPLHATSSLDVNNPELSKSQAPDMAQPGSPRCTWHQLNGNAFNVKPQQHISELTHVPSIFPHK